MITSSLTSENTKILMLGTIPGNASLEKLEYYGPQKTILENYIFFKEEGIPTLLRIKLLLLSKNIDFGCTKSVREKGAFVNIKNLIVNDFETLLSGTKILIHLF
jgi:hypothetical protein